MCRWHVVRGAAVRAQFKSSSQGSLFQYSPTRASGPCAPSTTLVSPHRRQSDDAKLEWWCLWRRGKGLRAALLYHPMRRHSHAKPRMIKLSTKDARVRPLSAGLRCCIGAVDCDCLLPADVTTVEGAGTVAQPHALQAQLAACDGSQCGYCSPGMIMTMVRRTTDAIAPLMRARAELAPSQFAALIALCAFRAGHRTCWRAIHESVPQGMQSRAHAPHLCFAQATSSLRAQSRAARRTQQRSRANRRLSGSAGRLCAVQYGLLSRTSSKPSKSQARAAAGPLRFCPCSATPATRISLVREIRVVC
jgi:hypothetical protein